MNMEVLISGYSDCRSFLASACSAIGLILVSPFGYAGSMDDDLVLDDKTSEGWFIITEGPNKGELGELLEDLSGERNYVSDSVTGSSFAPPGKTSNSEVKDRFEVIPETATKR